MGNTTTAKRSIMKKVTIQDKMKRSDVYDQKLKFANKIGFQNLADAIGSLGIDKFNTDFELQNRKK